MKRWLRKQSLSTKYHIKHYESNRFAKLTNSDNTKLVDLKCAQQIFLIMPETYASALYGGSKSVFNVRLRDLPAIFPSIQTIVDGQIAQCPLRIENLKRYIHRIRNDRPDPITILDRIRSITGHSVQIFS